MSVGAPDGLVDALLVAWAAAVGACVGSFLNVVIGRVPAGLSVVRPGSRCPRCLAPIRWYDNLPVLSWVLLRARCRRCGAPISARYPLVEALGAALAVVAVARHGLSGAAAAELAFAAALVALAFIDLDTWLLPNVITWPLLAFGLAMGALGASHAGSFRAAAYGAGIGFAAFAGVAFLGARAFRKEALGFGDVWLLAGLGAWLGPGPLLPAVLLASLQGTIAGVALILLGKAQPGPEVQTRGGGPTEGGGGAERPSEPGHPAPTAPPAGRGGTPRDEWIPPRNAVPFGPFLVAGALEWLWLGHLAVRHLPSFELFL